MFRIGFYIATPLIIAYNADVNTYIRAVGP